MKNKKMVKNKKRRKEKISSLMQDKARDFGSERKLNKARESRLVGKNRSQDVLSLTATSKYNKSLSFLFLFLIFSFIFMVIAEEGQIEEQEIFSKLSNKHKFINVI